MKREKGFTLIELLVVISIISLLSSVVLSSLSSAKMKARDTSRKMAFKEIQKALELYHLDKGYYPYGEWSSSIDNVCPSDANCWTTTGLSNSLSPYIKSLPQDPNFSNRGSNVIYGKWFTYAYERKSDDSYCLAGTLENSSDSSIQSPNANCFGHNPAWPNYSILFN